MRYVVLVPDGAADYPLDELGGQTPLEAAATPCMDRLAREGAGGLVQMIPAQRHPGSDIGNLEIFGYDSRVHYTGRASLEAASMGVDLGDDGVAFRLNLIYGEGDVLVDYSAGHIASEEAAELVAALAAELGGGVFALLSRGGLSSLAGVGLRPGRSGNLSAARHHGRVHGRA